MTPDTLKELKSLVRALWSFPHDPLGTEYKRAMEIIDAELSLHSTAEIAGTRAAKLWLWKNFVDGRPEYWAFDNAYPCESADGDPLTLGEPCGYALVKESAKGREYNDGDVLAAIRIARNPEAGELATLRAQLAEVTRERDEWKNQHEQDELLRIECNVINDKLEREVAALRAEAEAGSPRALSESRQHVQRLQSQIGALRDSVVIHAMESRRYAERLSTAQRRIADLEAE